MRLVMMGTGPFAVPTFRGLFETHHEIVALVTSPIRDPAAATPMRDVARERGIRVFDPEKINTPEAQRQLLEWQGDLAIVCDYGQILSAESLATARLGGVNLHASLLPKYRGAAPINWALYHGEKETGVSVIHMTPRVDAGPVIAQAPLPIDSQETAVELERRLAEIGAWLIRRAIDAIESGVLEALPQNPALASKAPRLKKTDGLLRWERPAEALRNHVRAMEPWPKTYTYWLRPKGAPLRMIVGPVAASPRPATTDQVDARPGTVLVAENDTLLVASGDAAVRLSTLQPSGKRPMAVAEFLRGYKLAPGDLFGSAEAP